MKPKEILEIEKIINKKISRAKYEPSVMSDTSNCWYLLDKEELSIIGLKLPFCFIKHIDFLHLLPDLELLDLGFNRINDINVIGTLIKLREIRLWKNQVSNISALINNPYLTKIDLSCNQIKDLTPLQELSIIQHLDVRENLISEIYTIGSLINLINLDISTNSINDGNALSNLLKLKILNLSNTNIKDYTFLRYLKEITEINLFNNQIKSLHVLPTIKSLKSLYIDSNKIRDITLESLLKFPNLQFLCIKGNPLSKIPKEIIGDSNCLPALRTYLEDLEKGKSPNNEVKILLIGNGSVGKTQVANRLEKGKAYVFEENHNSTHAIDLHKKNLKCNFLQEGLDLNIWDFGGQDIYHATHHLFMQTRALFILVWDVENEVEGSQHEYKGVKYDNFPLRYWLEYAKYFGKESPVLVVRNKTDIHGKEFMMPVGVKEKLKADFPNIVGFAEVSAKTGDNFYGLEKQIQKAFEENENLRNDLINKQLPTAWVRMRNKVREAQKEEKAQQISKETFYDWCAKELIPDSAPTLLDFFHQTGVLFYNEQYFSGQIILDQSWAITAVYKVLDKDAEFFAYLQEQQGKLTYTEICDIWQEYSDAQRELFLGFMLSCELCFEITENKKHDISLKDRTFIVPQLLPKEMSFSAKNMLASLPLQEKKHFAFLPTSLIQRFIIKAHALAKIEDIWQQGILLHYGNARALVQAVYAREPYLQIHYNEAAKTNLVPAIWAEFDKLEGKEKAKSQPQGDFMEKHFWGGLDSLIAPNKKYSKKEIQSLIANDKIEEAIQGLLLHYEGNDEVLKEITLQASRFSRISQQYRKGTISLENYETQSNQLNDALLSVLNTYN